MSWNRFLHRLSRSPYADRLVLKGGMLLAVLDARRSTRDADLLARAVHGAKPAVGRADIDQVVQHQRVILSCSVGDRFGACALHHGFFEARFDASSHHDPHHAVPL